ncbi:hypothetical protein LEP1GSC036_0440 [Leptospira weilii str. 2006001853]|uniref:Uncharacterized protein n=3 Tax=Leptospira weilii TaxID=28184 RepID=A0A828Z4I4_9LEPT|nr:hypothetical protein LEP1GSC036_0440 [Leptospira weilii str. 2006001853]EMM73523.1 hypothetical protein LEP1GSC038_2580 [Leptospira weilii str. 2006001855]EMN44856.1 hypothetical protein LEP1GSC086_0706 [Leptospira weilii str. LNT 1234]EMN87902.1 hypothetical protein LEP1GSC108_0785 [Leptospira weilii str. UI 13098]
MSFSFSKSKRFFSSRKRIPSSRRKEIEKTVKWEIYESFCGITDPIK